MLVASYPSPNEVHMVNVYVCAGNATVADSIRAEVITGAKTRNIYWQYDETDCLCEWLSDEIICINGKVLNVLSDTYDCRQ